MKSITLEMETDMKKRENKYERSFKVEALKLLENSRKSITAVADDLGISPNLLMKWKARYEVNQERDDVEAVSSKGSGCQAPIFSTKGRT